MHCVVDSADNDDERRMCEIWCYTSLQTHRRRTGSALRCAASRLKRADIHIITTERNHDPKSCCFARPWVDARPAQPAPTPDVCDGESEPAALDTPSLANGRRPRYRRSEHTLHREHVQPCMPYARTGRPNAHAQRAQLVLHGPRQRRGKEASAHAARSM